MSQDQRTDPPASDGILWQIFLILAASAFAPLQVFNANEEAPSLLTALAVTLAVTGIGLFLRWTLVRFGWEPLGATYAVVLFVGLSMNTGYLIRESTVSRWVVLMGLVLVAAIGYRLRELKIFQILMTWGAFLLIAIPVVAKLGEGGGLPPSIQIDEQVHSLQRSATPDVVVIVSDGYASAGVLEEFFGVDNFVFYGQLEESGFEVGEEVVANYPITALSVSSVLSLDYVVEEGAAPTRADADLLYEVIGGNNRLADALREHGYRQTYVESGWLGTRCRSHVDDCVAGPWPDESIYDIALKSVLTGLPGFEVGQTFTRGALHSMTWLDTDLEGLLTNDRADYVYVHLLAPHPPYFLDPACENEPRAEMSGFRSGDPDSTPDELKSMRNGYWNQIQCVNSVLTRVAELAAATNAIVVMFGDHGSDTTGQLFVDGREWSDAQIRERFGAFFAGYGEGCDFSDLGSLVNVGRRVLSCLGDDSTPDLATRAFIVNEGESLQEIHPTLVDD